MATKVSIGRGDECDIKITDLKASRKHAEFILTAKGWVVQDAGSANGILHNGAVVRNAPLQSRDSLTVGENVAFPLRERGGLEEEQIYQIIDGLLDMVGVREFRDQLPSDLSTGMKRSVAIARALAAQPEAVLYDEPTTMVDPLMAHLLGDLIKKLKRQLKLTSIVVTHDMVSAKTIATRIALMDEGKIVIEGSFDELQQSDERFVSQFLHRDF